MSDCPCSSGRAFAECCEPYLSGAASPPTAEALMRARYTAFATSNIDFIINTILPARRGQYDTEEVRKWSEDSTWHGLEIVDVEDGGPDDDTGVVVFRAQYRHDNQDVTHDETATFEREGGAWYFADGKLAGAETYVRPGPKVGRNDPCPCGSGRKYKRCCG